MALAAAAGVGALCHRPVPAVLLVLVAAVVVAIQRPVVAIAGVAVLASGLAARSHAGLDPVAAGPCRAVVTLVGDPVPTMFGWRADVRLGHRRVELEASDAAGGALAAALAGERVAVEGRLRPPRPDSPWLVPRHVVGRLDADSVERVDAGAAPWRAANRFRRLLQEGAGPMDETAQALYRGFVLGDDRDQSVELVDDFRGAGLTHLLVVSGQKIRSQGASDPAPANSVPDEEDGDGEQGWINRTARGGPAHDLRGRWPARVLGRGVLLRRRLDDPDD